MDIHVSLLAVAVNGGRWSRRSRRGSVVNPVGLVVPRKPGVLGNGYYRRKRAENILRIIKMRSLFGA